MFQPFLRARVHNFIRDRLGGADFRVRSGDRDSETDRSRINSILTAIEMALTAAEKEHAGLNQRIDDVLARAAVTVGNAADEYIDREPLDDYHQSLFNDEIINGQRRLKELSAMISHFKFVKTAMLTRFPDYKSTSTK
jgi:hypothetical protein